MVNEHALEEGMKVTRGSILVEVAAVADDGSVTVQFPHGETLEFDGDEVVRMLWRGDLETEDGRNRELVTDLDVRTRAEMYLESARDTLSG